MKYNLHGSEFFLITAECAWGNVSAHPHFFPFYHPQGVLNKYLETNSDLAHCGGITVIWEIRKWNQASWFCSFLFPFLLHSRVERSTQTHMRCSGFAQRQQETCYYKVFLLWQYYHVNPHMGFFFVHPLSFLTQLDTPCLDICQSRKSEGYSGSYGIVSVWKISLFIWVLLGFGFCNIFASCNSLWVVLF